MLSGVKGCAYCGGLGLRILNCPKLEQQKSTVAISNSRKDYFGSGKYRGEILVSCFKVHAIILCRFPFANSLNIRNFGFWLFAICRQKKEKLAIG